jgi:hypothetical protein
MVLNKYEISTPKGFGSGVAILSDLQKKGI